MDSFEEKVSSVVNEIADKKYIVVLVGAGISVSCGIPDFRSDGTGLYHTLNCQELGITNPEEIFDIQVFRDDPRPFFRFAHSLYPGKVNPGPSHSFLAWLERKNMLLRVYTQNIDGLEELAGVSKRKVVYAHGSLLTATCMKCRKKYNAEDIADDINAKTVPLCDHPKDKRENGTISSVPSSNTFREFPIHSMSLRNRAKKQCLKLDTYDDLNSRGLCGGVIKPNITFFGEKLVGDVARRLQKDMEKVDALIVMGTSLSVAPISKLVDMSPANIPRILINHNHINPPSTIGSSSLNSRFFNTCLLGNCDDIVQAIQMQWKRISKPSTISINPN